LPVDDATFFVDHLSEAVRECRVRVFVEGGNRGADELGTQPIVVLQEGDEVAVDETQCTVPVADLS
jgi:hypothetical protein